MPSFYDYSSDDDSEEEESVNFQFFDPVPDLTPKGACWNPLAFIPGPEKKDKPLGDVGMITKIFQDAIQIVKDYGIDITPSLLDWEIEGLEVGDDRVDISNNPLTLAVAQVVQQDVFEMKTSYYDTFISARYYNFCETTSGIPCAREQSIYHAKKEGKKNLGFVDSPPVRLIINCQKTDRSHSSTAVGKATMLGIKIRDCNPKHLLILQIASFIQDACLGTTEMKEPKYMHNVMGGCGCPDLFGNYHNTYTYMKNFKHGTYDRVYGTATNEIRETISQLDMGFPAEAHLCQRLRLKQEYLHGTYGPNVLLPPTTLKGTESESFPLPIYTKAGTSSSISGVELRLVRAKRLMTESSARIEYDKTVRLESTIMGMNHIHSAEFSLKQILFNKRKQYDGALSANTAFANLIHRTANGTEVQTLIDEGFIKVGTGVLRFSKEDAKWLNRGGKGEAFSINDIPTSENIFLWDEVNKEKTMKIPGIPLRPLLMGTTPRVTTTIAKVGLWQITGDMEDWADDIVRQLTDERRESGNPTLPFGTIKSIYQKNREWVSDDTALIAQASEDAADEVITQCVLLVSGDKRLARQMSITTANHVVRIEPAPLMLKLGLTVMTATTEIPLRMVRNHLPVNFFSDKMIREPVRIYIDTGSCEAELKYLSKEALSFRHRRTVGYFYNELKAVNSNHNRSCSVEKFLLDPNALILTGQVFWPNTIKMEFQSVLIEPLSGTGREQQQRGSVPRRWWKKYF
jgi:hypothetical protein